MQKLQNMVDLSRASAMDGMVTASPAMPSAPIYPYGLSISLTQDELAKLDVDYTDWTVGDHFNLQCLAKITSISEHETEGGKNCRVEMQIVAMAGDETEEGDDEDDNAGG